MSLSVISKFCNFNILCGKSKTTRFTELHTSLIYDHKIQNIPLFIKLHAQANLKHLVKQNMKCAAKIQKPESYGESKVA